MKDSIRFPQDLLRFLYWVFFKPLILQNVLRRVDPSLTNVAAFLRNGPADSFERRELARLTLFYALLAPCILGFGLGIALAVLGLDLNWSELALFLTVGTLMSLTFSPIFCIAFLLPFSLAAALFSGTGVSVIIGIFMSFSLGTAYGLMLKPARWGLIAGGVYGAALAYLTGPWIGLAIGAAYLAGYFRLPLYLVEALLAWLLSILAAKNDASCLWSWQPIVWDELIWFPLPGLNRHLQTLASQDQAAANAALELVNGSFRQQSSLARMIKD